MLATNAVTGIAVALGPGILGRCAPQVLRRHVLPTVFFGPFYVVRSDEVGSAPRVGGKLTVEFNGEGVAYINKSDAAEHSQWGSDEFEHADGSHIVALTPGTGTAGPWAEVKRFVTEGRTVRLNGRDVQVRLEHYEGYLGKGPKTERWPPGSIRKRREWCRPGRSTTLGPYHESCRATTSFSPVPKGSKAKR